MNLIILGGICATAAAAAAAASCRTFHPEKGWMLQTDRGQDFRATPSEYGLEANRGQPNQSLFLSSVACLKSYARSKERKCEQHYKPQQGNKDVKWAGRAWFIVMFRSNCITESFLYSLSTIL